MASTPAWREFVEAIAEGFTDCHHQTQDTYCSHCGVNLDNGEDHKNDCMMLRAKAFLAAVDAGETVK